MSTLTYKVSLDTGSRKFICPACGKRTFVKMKDHETGEYLPDHVGRCDRENNCGYHFTYKQYAGQLGLPLHTLIKPKKEEFNVEPEIDFMPLDYVERSMQGCMQTNFAKYLTDLFGHEIALKAISNYFVGRSRNDNGKASVFWRIDKDEQVRTGKIMFYNPETGKRNKDINPTWVHKSQANFNYQLCFFGEHLLTEYPDKLVGIVESEKTAIIASIYMPDLVWIATGGNSCKWREWSVNKVLQNRKVILFPDFGYYNKKAGKTCFDEWTERAINISDRMNCIIQVSSLLEKSLSPEERLNDFDLADFFVKRENSNGWALTDHGYPYMWDATI